MLFVLIYYVMIFVCQNGPMVAQNFNLMGKIWRKAFQQTRPTAISNALLKNKKKNHHQSSTIISKSGEFTPEIETESDTEQIFTPQTPSLSDEMAALENPFKRRMFRFVFSASIRCGRWFANNFCCLDPKEHKVARLTARLGSSLVPKCFAGVDFTVSTIAGVRCNIYRPKIVQQQTTAVNTRIKLPVVVYTHGGGWTISSAAAYHDFTSKLSRDTGAIVVSVDYSLAPERPYPHGYEDCLAVTRCLLNADTIMTSPFISGRVDTGRIIVAGDSAGGNLSACVALDLIRANDRRLRAQVLICPCLQAVNFQLPSYVRMAPEYALDWFVANYAGVKPTEAALQAMRRGEHLLPEGRALRQKYAEMPKSEPTTSTTSTTTLSPNVPQRLAELCSTVEAWPLLADDAHLAQLPSTLVQGARFDPMLDENILFAKRLEKAGTQNVRFSIMENAEHCESVFAHVLKTKASIDGYSEVVAFIQEISR